jgi:uncharacterized membrane protein YgaE (UPF0421/DUF939 family)
MDRSRRGGPLRLLDRPAAHWAAASRDILLSTAAAALAWRLAVAWTGNPQPIFAAIAAIVCLAPGVASHRRQAVGMLIGVSIGIVVAEIARAVPGVEGTWRIAAVTLVTMFAASSFGLNAVMVIQAGASAVLVIGSTAHTVAADRFAHTAIGGGVGLLFTQVLFTSDPLGQVRAAVARLATASGAVLDAMAGPVERSDTSTLAARTEETRAAEAALSAALATADAIVRLTVRGRLAAPRVDAELARVRAVATALTTALQSLAARSRDPDVDTATLRARADDALRALRTG